MEEIGRVRICIFPPLYFGNSGCTFHSEFDPSLSSLFVTGEEEQFSR